MNRPKFPPYVTSVHHDGVVQDAADRLAAGASGVAIGGGCLCHSLFSPPGSGLGLGGSTQCDRGDLTLREGRFVGLIAAGSGTGPTARIERVAIGDVHLSHTFG